MTSRASPTSRPTSAVVLLAALTAVLGWVYWPTLGTLVSRWSSDPQYTHGYVVPAFAAVVLWFRRDRFPKGKISYSWLGLPLLLIAAVMHLAGAVFAFEWLAAGSLLPAVAGVALISVGPAVSLWAWPVAAFLAVALPWPWQLDQLLTFPLRRIATVCSTYILQTIGLPALARGNIIVINDLEVGVVEACSGLGMLMTFFALSIAVALIIRRPWFERWAIFFSAIPIGVLVNVGRITVTVLLYQWVSAESAKLLVHDAAGWLMMLAALVVMWLEMLLLGRLWRPYRLERPVPVPVPVVSAPAEPPRWAARRSSPKVLRPAAPAQQRALQEIPDAAP